MLRLPSKPIPSRQQCQSLTCAPQPRIFAATQLFEPFFQNGLLTGRDAREQPQVRRALPLRFWFCKRGTLFLLGCPYFASSSAPLIPPFLKDFTFQPPHHPAANKPLKIIIDILYQYAIIVRQVGKILPRPSRHVRPRRGPSNSFSIFALIPVDLSRTEQTKQLPSSVHSSKFGIL